MNKCIYTHERENKMQLAVVTQFEMKTFFFLVNCYLELYHSRENRLLYE